MDEFEIQAYTANAVDQIYIGLSNRQHKNLLELATYVKGVVLPGKYLLHRAHRAFRNAVKDAGVDLAVAEHVYENTLSGVLDKVWASLSEDEQRRRLHQLKQGK